MWVNQLVGPASAAEEAAHKSELKQLGRDRETNLVIYTYFQAALKRGYIHNCHMQGPFEAIKTGFKLIFSFIFTFKGQNWCFRYYTRANILKLY